MFNLRVLKENNKSKFNSYNVRNSVLIISYTTFRDCRVHFFPKTFLQIAVYVRQFLWDTDGSYLSEILFNAVLSVGFKSLLSLYVDSHAPHVHGKLSNQVFAVRVIRADSRNLGPLIPLSKLCQSLSLIDV